MKLLSKLLQPINGIVSNAESINIETIAQRSRIEALHVASVDVTIIMTLSLIIFRCCWYDEILENGNVSVAFVTLSAHSVFVSLKKLYEAGGVPIKSRVDEFCCGISMPVPVTAVSILSSDNLGVLHILGTKILIGDEQFFEIFHNFLSEVENNWKAMDLGLKMTVLKVIKEFYRLNEFDDVISHSKHRIQAFLENMEQCESNTSDIPLQDEKNELLSIVTL